MRTSKIRTTVIRAAALGLLAVGTVVAAATPGLASSAATVMAPTPAVVAVAPAPAVFQATAGVRTPPQTIERRQPQYQVVNHLGKYSSGSVSIQYGLEWVHADVPCCMEPIPGQFRARGYAMIGKNHLAQSVRVRSMVLMGEQRILNRSGASGPSGSVSNLATKYTPWFNEPTGQTPAYRVKVTFSVRWNDGTVTHFSRTSPLTSSGQ